MAAPPEIRSAIDAVWRIEAGRVIAGLTRLVGDVGVAEELAQDALVAALEQWPESGIPVNPGAWLTTTAKRRAIDLLRRRTLGNAKYEELARRLRTGATDVSELDSPLDDDEFGDDVLRLMFVACHPILPTDGRVALTLRLLGGLTTAEIARAFLVRESTVAQRIVRAKRTLAEAHVPFEVPSGTERAARLASVLEVVYLVFNEGYTASSGDDWLRPGLCADALRLGRSLATMLEDEPEVHGLVALMELQASRARARIGPRGEPVLLSEQDRTRWDPLLVGRGLAALARSERLGGLSGPYRIQAAIAACHARARRSRDTDWERIVGLYDALCQLIPSPVVELNRAVAVGMAFGPAEALPLVDQLAAQDSLRNYHYVGAVRADLLERLGRLDEARAGFEAAAALTHNDSERDLLLRRARRCAPGATGAPDRPLAIPGILTPWPR